VGKGVRAAGAIARPDRGRSPGIRVPNLGGVGDRGGRGGSPFPLLDALGRSGGGGGRGGSPFPLLDVLGRAGGGGGRGGSPFPLLDALGGASSGRGGNNDFPILRELERQSRGNDRGNKHSGNDALDLLYGLQQFGGYGGYPGQGYGYDNGAYPYYDSHNRYRADEQYSDAIRDAAIANAVGNVVSAIVQTQSVRTQPPAYVQQAPVYAQPAPAYSQPSRTYVAPSPQGYYETRREIVGGGHYEREQIWVPESRDPRTGHFVEGHNETVRRWVPEVIQESRVWVAP